MTIHNKSILITGATGGIGGALAPAYAAPGVTLILQGRRLDRLEEMAGECRALGARVLLEALADEVAHTGMVDLDPFDLLLHVAYDQPPLTRRERAQRVKKRNVFTQYGPVARKVLDALLDKYADEGIATIESNEVFKLQPFTDLGSPVELVRSFGGRPQYLSALQALEQALYATHPAP